MIKYGIETSKQLLKSRVLITVDNVTQARRVLSALNGTRKRAGKALCSYTGWHDASSTALVIQAGWLAHNPSPDVKWDAIYTYTQFMDFMRSLVQQEIEDIEEQIHVLECSDDGLYINGSGNLSRYKELQARLAEEKEN